MVYERLVRPWLFKLDPERAHDMTSWALRSVSSVPGGEDILSVLAGRPARGLETEAFGLKFPNPIGLAAGFDKDARMIDGLAALGFGFIEVGSITLRPQPGNPKPRLFRVPEEQALINRFGFNSAGADAAARRLLGRHAVPVGVNLGLNKDTPGDRAPAEYAETFSRLAGRGDYFVVNVSSPNTAGLRGLQRKLELQRILEAIQERNLRQAPLLVKLDCDLPDEGLEAVLPAIRKLASGVVVSNTTTARDGVPERWADVRGGLSGRPLRARATVMIRKVRALSPLPIVGTGGIFSGADAYEKIRAGACLVQLYTGMIYRGPGAARAIGRELAELLARDGYTRVAQAVGTEPKLS